MEMPKFVFAATIAACICTSVAFAQDNRGTPEQQAACTPDAFRLCSSFIPDPAKVESCLRQRKQDLSNACRLVFDYPATTASMGSK
jgi:hypothetical protein